MVYTLFDLGIPRRLKLDTSSSRRELLVKTNLVLGYLVNNVDATTVIMFSTTCTHTNVNGEQLSRTPVYLLKYIKN